MRSVVVTGASTGIGRAVVARLVASGFHVWGTVRRQAAAESLSSEHGEAVSPLLMDVTDEASVRAAGERVTAAGPLFGLVNNAGVALPAPLEHVPLDVLRRQLEVNLVGQLAVTQAMLPALRAGRARDHDARIVMIGSIAGRVAGPMLGPYHAAKFGLVGLTGALRAELAPSGIRVILIEPGAIATPIWTRGAADAQQLVAGLPAQAQERYRAQIDAALADARSSAARALPAERAAATIVRSLTDRNPRPRRVVGRDAQRIAALVRVLPHRALYRATAARTVRPRGRAATEGPPRGGAVGTALVTGAAAGLGLEFARQLATAGHDLVLVDRDVERLERLAGRLHAAAGVHVEVLVADLSVRDDVERVAERLRSSERPVGLLVNNAGAAPGQRFVGGDLQREEAVLDVMVRCVLVLSHAAAGQMTARGRGAILNVASVAALITLGTYSADKAWVRTFTEALSVELRGTGVTATVVCPGFVRTEFHESAGIDMTWLPGIAWLQAGDVVADALAAARRGAVISTPGLRYRLGSAAARVMPRSLVRAMGSPRSSGRSRDPVR